MATDIPVYDTVPTDRVSSDIVRVGDSLYSFDSADGAYAFSGLAPELAPPPSFEDMMFGSFGGVGMGAMPATEGIPIEREGMTPPSGMSMDPLIPTVISYPDYPSGFGLSSPLGGEPSRIDWSTVPDYSLGGGGESTVGDIAVGSGGELMTALPGSWMSVGSLYGTPFWTPHEDYGPMGVGELTLPDTLPTYTPIPGPRDFTGAGFGYAIPEPEPDYSAYVESYPDLGAAYTSYKAGGGPKYPTVADYGEWHWDKYGEPEGRELAMTEPYIPEDWYPYSSAPPVMEYPVEGPPVDYPTEYYPPFFPTDDYPYPPDPFYLTDPPPIDIPPIEPSLDVLESIATGTLAESEPTGTLPPVAPPAEPVAETMLPTPPVESVAPPVVDPYVAPSTPPASGGISSSPMSTAMRVLSPSFEGGGGILCDPITGKCPNYG